MGTHYTAKAIFGVKLVLENPTFTAFEGGCAHSVPDGVKFCSECGSPARRKVTRTKQVYWDLLEFLNANLPRDFTFEFFDYTFVVGVGWEIPQGDCIRVEMPDPEATAARIRTMLEPAGYWPLVLDGSLGLWLTNVGR